MSRELPSSPFQAPALPEKAQKKPKQKRKIPALVKALGLAAGLHAAAIGGGPAIKAAREGIESWEQHRTIERIRAEAVERALHEIETNRLRFWEFARDTDEADLMEAEMPIPPRESIEASFNEAVQKVLEEQQGYLELHSMDDAKYLQESLGLALEKYHYTAGRGDMDVQGFFQEHGGPCGTTSLAVASILDRAGYGKYLALRFYPEGEHGEPAHVAPTISFTDESGLEHEIDLVGGGAVVPGGTRMTLPDVVTGYALERGLIPQPVDARWSKLQTGHATATTSSHAPEVSPGPARKRNGWSLATPASHGERNFPGGAPFYAEHVIGAYHTDEEGRVVDRDGRAMNTGEAGLTFSEEGLGEDFMRVLRSKRFIERSFDRHLTSNLVHTDEAVDVELRVGLSEVEWTKLSELISWAEQRLQEDVSDSERLCRLGIVTGLYRLASTESLYQLRQQSYELAEEKISRYREEAEPILARHMNDRNLFIDMIGDNVNAYAPALSALGRSGHTMLWNLYHSIPSNPEGSYLDFTTTDALLYLLLMPDTREQALKTFSSLTTTQQFLLADRLAYMGLGSGGFVSGKGVTLEGRDEFSFNYRAHQALFGDHLDERLAGGRIGQSDTTLNETFERISDMRLNSMSEIEDEIRVYAQTHGRNHDWEEQVMLYGVLTIQHRIRNFGTFHRYETAPRIAVEMRPILEQAVVWLRRHPRPDTEYAITDLEHFIRVSRQIEGE